jgi:hypothetical protein
MLARPFGRTSRAVLEDGARWRTLEDAEVCGLVRDELLREFYAARILTRADAAAAMRMAREVTDAILTPLEEERDHAQAHAQAERVFVRGAGVADGRRRHAGVGDQGSAAEDREHLCRLSA